jgi:predicted enzyme related to lactoylglutathione lyase
MANATVQGRFVWHELYTPNPQGSQEFYGDVLAWQIQTFEQAPDYPMFAASAGPVGAPIEARNGTPQWIPYIGTADVDATTEAAARLGGRVQTPPTDIPSGGRYALIVDPQGATFGIHASAAHQPETAPGAGEFSWHELATNVAPGAAFGFYAALFDWDLIREYDMGPMGMYLVFGRRGRELGGVFDQTAAGKTGPAYWLGYVSTTDLAGTVERAKAARASVLVPPMDVPGGDRIAQLMDPHGAFFALHQAASEAAGAGNAAAPRKPPKKAAGTRAKQAARPPAKKRAAKKARAKKAPARRAKAAPRKKAAKRPAAKKRPGAKKRPTVRKPKAAVRRPGKKKATKKKRGR